MDLDCIGSIVLARYIFPDHVPVMSRLIHPVAKNLYNLYHYHLNFMPSKDLKGENIEHMVVVDTRSESRVREYFELIGNDNPEMEIFDHHKSDHQDYPDAVLHESNCGSNTTMIGLELIKKRLTVSPKDATIALTGIYADTGNFTYDTVCEDDFRVASFLLKHKADIKLVSNFLKSLKEDYQINLLHDMLNKLVWQDINGHQIIFSYHSMEKQSSGLSSVVEEIFSIENPDAIFSVFYFEKPGNTIIIARSQKNVIDLIDILEPFGGGGHTKAASALIKKEEGRAIFQRLLEHLTQHLTHAVVAGQLMTCDVVTLRDDWTLLEASMFLEEVDLSGGPVLNAKDELVGMLTLRDIMKGRKGDQMNSPVRAYMKTRLITCSSATTVREIENIMFMNSIGHLPVVDEGKLVGIITRADYLTFLQNK